MLILDLHLINDNFAVIIFLNKEFHYFKLINLKNPIQSTNCIKIHNLKFFFI